MERAPLIVHLLIVDGKFSQHENWHSSLDVDELVRGLRAVGLDPRLLPLEALVDAEREPRPGSVVWVGGHPDPEVMQYIGDWILVGRAPGVRVVPGAELVACFENKGAQGLLARRVGLPFVEQGYRVGVPGDVEFPVVFKAPGGAGSSQVRKITSAAQFARARRAQVVRSASLDRLRKHIKYGLGAALHRGDGAQKRFEVRGLRARYVLQEFVPDLDHDYKVLVFGNDAYVLFRGVRPGDFRASGSGHFDFVEAPSALLEFASSCRAALETPYISLDVVATPVGYRVVEFQAVHFGPHTQIHAPHFYRRTGRGWERHEDPPSLERCYVGALSGFLGSPASAHLGS